MRKSVCFVSWEADGSCCNSAKFGGTSYSSQLCDMLNPFEADGCPLARENPFE
uniref:Uncharacterized protein n=1 Tax=Anopheles minimus TaxID=112268 RepID=A0A182WPJ4_9DIPT